MCRLAPRSRRTCTGFEGEPGWKLTDEIEDENILCGAGSGTNGRKRAAVRQFDGSVHGVLSEHAELCAFPIDPDESRGGLRNTCQVHEHSVLRHRKRAVAAGARQYVLDNGLRIAGRLEPLDVERLCHECRVPHEQQVSLRIHHLRHPLCNLAPLAGIDACDHDRG